MMTNQQVNILPAEERHAVLGAVQEAMLRAGIDTLVVADNANLFYLTGRVFDGYMLVPAQGAPAYFVRRPIHLAGENVTSIRKPEEIPAHTPIEGVLALELDHLSFSQTKRLATAFGRDLEAVTNASALLRQVRSVKTPWEVERIRRSGVLHREVYKHIPTLYREGMTDIELQVEIERLARLEGCLGIFRIDGKSMEIFMGNLLAGDNADAPSPYDFAMGGAGAHPSLPVGAAGSVIRPGMSVMVDMNGNFTGYMTDMSRTYRLGQISELAAKAHQCSIDICHELASLTRPGMEAKALYESAMEIVRACGLEAYFMGHRQHAGFIGHGVGIEINELPVIAPRSRQILAEGNVIALEPKFVVPGTGAVGIENTYLLTDAGLECLTGAPEEIIELYG